MLLGKLGASLLGNILTGIGISKVGMVLKIFNPKKEKE